jgi:carbon storage regulator
MLVLSRRKNEVILVGDNIRLHVVSIGRRSVRLAIEAPVDVRILRGEIEQHFNPHRAATTSWEQVANEQEKMQSA